MMRLFWRILGGYFLAWALLSLGLFGALALDARARLLPRPAVSQTLPSAVSVQMAATNVRFGGEKVFRRMAENWPRTEPPYVVDIQGHEMLGRDVDPDVLEAARSLAVDSSERTPVKLVTGPDDRQFVIYHPEGTGPQDRGTFYWFLEQPWLLGIVFAGAGLVLAGGLAAAWTRPIAGLESAFDAVSDGHVQVKVDPRITRRRDELGDLGRHFEEMSRRLARSIGAQRQLLHDISHEIRSPLARLSVASAMARRRPDRIDEALERIERECQRLDRLVGGVLTLARLEGEVPVPLDDYFDFYELLRVVRDDVAFEADPIGIEVALTIPDRKELVMHGNAELLHRAVENVVRNAIQHSEGTNRIEILLDDPGAHESVLLRVRNRGKGIGEEEIESLFEPFTRGRASTGFGLGLAIAHRAVAVHKGSIHATSLPEGGVEVQILLPLEAVRQNTIV
jgi:two-component system OmpR family sensor kinase